METEFKVGQTVKFSVPQTEGEKTERFIIRELRGDRVLVQDVCDLPIKPTCVYLVADLTPAE